MKTSLPLLAALAAAGSLLPASVALNNGMGRVPQMGWNSWYSQWMTPTDAHARATAVALKQLGLFDVGFRTVTVDDGWAMERDKNTHLLVPYPNLFPQGMAALGDYIRSLNFTYGMYLDRGTALCGGPEGTGSQGYESVDADFVINTCGARYLKIDSCEGPSDPQTAFSQYAALRDAILATQQPVFYALCGWEPFYSAVGHALGNSWRIGPDDNDFELILTDIDTMAPLWPNAGPGGFNDPCLLLGRDISGQDLITEQQSRFQFSMWAVLAAPMILSQDVTNMTAFRLETYTNTEVIAVGQDPMARQGQRVVGGPISLSKIAERDGLDGPPITLQKCSSVEGPFVRGGGVSVVTAQQWTWNVSGPQYVNSVADPDMCMNVDDCGVNIVAFQCVTSGGTCCGADCYDNEKFSFSSDGTLRSPIAPNSCVTSNGVNNEVTLSPCTPGNAAQQFSYDAATQSFRDDSGNNCLTIGSGNATRVNVWARPLSDGSWAFAYVNVDIDTASLVACGPECLGITQWAPDQVFAVRDLWEHADLGNTTVASGWNVTNLMPDGGVALFKFTPVWGAPPPAPPSSKKAGRDAAAARKTKKGRKGSGGK